MRACLRLVQTGSFNHRDPDPGAFFDEQAVYITVYLCFSVKSLCVPACPVNAIAIDPNTEAKVVMDECVCGAAPCVPWRVRMAGFL